MTDEIKAKKKPEWHDGLTAKERRFVEEYIFDFNGVQAAARAGFASKSYESAAAYASKLLKKQSVRAAVDKFLDEKGISAQRIVEELAAIAFADAGDYAKYEDGRVVITPTAKLTDHQRKAIAGYAETITEFGTTVKVTLNDKLGALDKLMKIARLGVERHEISGPKGGPIEVEQVDPLERIKQRLNELQKAREASKETVKTKKE